MLSGQSVYVNGYYVTLFAWLCNYIVVGIGWFFVVLFSLVEQEKKAHRNSNNFTNAKQKHKKPGLIAT